MNFESSTELSSQLSYIYAIIILAKLIEVNKDVRLHRTFDLSRLFQYTTKLYYWFYPVRTSNYLDIESIRVMLMLILLSYIIVYLSSNESLPQNESYLIYLLKRKQKIPPFCKLLCVILYKIYWPVPSINIFWKMHPIKFEVLLF